MTKKQIYLLLDSKSAPLARGVLETAPDGSVLQIHILDGKEAVSYTHLTLPTTERV